MASPTPPPAAAASRPLSILATFLLLLLFGVVSASNSAPLSSYGLPNHHYVSSCDSLARRSLCFHVHRIRHHRPVQPLPPPPPPPPDEEIDLRYGVEKRLVPSGPNPLHN